MVVRACGALSAGPLRGAPQLDIGHWGLVIARDYSRTRSRIIRVRAGSRSGAILGPAGPPGDVPPGGAPARRPAPPVSCGAPPARGALLDAAPPKAPLPRVAIDH